jgi:hypothetical protein
MQPWYMASETLVNTLLSYPIFGRMGWDGSGLEPKKELRITTKSTKDRKNGMVRCALVGINIARVHPIHDSFPPKRYNLLCVAIVFQ